MTDGVSELADTRREIDRIDDQLHDLLMERAALVDKVIAGKRQSGDSRQSGLRSAREAQILRRLLGRHHGKLPSEVIVRIWRELISAFTRMQGPLSIAICGGGDAGDFADLARFYYGSATPITTVNSEAQVLGAMDKTPGTIGIVPALSGNDPSKTWWTTLAASADAPVIIAQLPFVVTGLGDIPRVEAYVLGRGPLEDSGDDVSLLAISVDGGLSRAGVINALEREGLEAEVLGDAPFADGNGRDILCQVDGFVATVDDRRLVAVSEARGGHIRAIRIVGVHARAVRLTKS